MLSVEKEMATYSSILTWEIQWTEKPGGLQPMGSQRVRHDWVTKQQKCHLYVLSWLTCHLWGIRRSENNILRKRGLGFELTLNVPLESRLLLSHVSRVQLRATPPGSPIPGILQARTLEWVAISFSNAWKWKVKVKPLSCVQLLATPWTAAYQAPPSMGFSRQGDWSGLPVPSLIWIWPYDNFSGNLKGLKEASVIFLGRIFRIQWLKERIME